MILNRCDAESLIRVLVLASKESGESYYKSACALQHILLVYESGFDTYSQKMLSRLMCQDHPEALSYVLVLSLQSATLNEQEDINLLALRCLENIVRFEKKQVQDVFHKKVQLLNSLCCLATRDDGFCDDKPIV